MTSKQRTMQEQLEITERAARSFARVPGTSRNPRSQIPYYTHRSRWQTIDTLEHPFIEEDAQRVAFMLSPDGTPLVTPYFGPLGGLIEFTPGIYLDDARAPFYFSWENWGPIITWPWGFFTYTHTEGIYISEILYIGE